MATVHALDAVNPEHLALLERRTSEQVGRPALSDAPRSAGPERLTAISLGDPERPDALLVGFSYGRSHLDAEPLGSHGVRAEDLEEMVPDLMEAVANQVDRVRIWLHRPDPELTATLRRLGFTLESSLIEMHVALPISADPRPSGLQLRPFLPGVDDDAWLEVNRRSFQGHPEQGAWSRGDIAARRAEAWFDPEGFICAWEDRSLAGSCWTKVHHEGGVDRGEIYVIGVDPSQQGKGLGRELVLAGFEHLASCGCREGFLSVRDDNDAALKLYADLGMREQRRSELWSRATNVS